MSETKSQDASTIMRKPPKDDENPRFSLIKRKETDHSETEIETALTIEEYGHLKKMLNRLRDEDEENPTTGDILTVNECL
jgi:hypothetical protein